jgi:4-oxalocrotonate tautomerase
MPLVRIDVPKGKSQQHRKALADIIHDAMLATLKVPQSDRFQIITEHIAADLIIDRTYLDIARTDDAIIIQVTLNEGRTVEMKKAFYKAVTEGLNQKMGHRREDVTISLVEVKKEDWSFGNGIAQYA